MMAAMPLPARRAPRVRLASAAGRLALALFAGTPAFVPSAAGAANQITLEVRLEPERIGMGETAILSIEASTGLSRLDLRPSFGLENLEIVAGPSQADEVRVESGRFSRTVRLSWQVRPLAVGPARVHSIRVGLGGRMVGMPPQTIEVQQEPTGRAEGPGDESPFGEEDPFDRFFGPMAWRRPVAPPAAGPNEPPLAFIRAEVSNDQPFVNQQVLYTIYLYSRIEVSTVNPQSTPELRGFWARDIPLPQRLPTELVTLGNVRYGRVPLLRRILFPIRSGVHVLEPVRFQIATMQFTPSYFSPPFARPMATDLSTPALRIDVRPLPEGPSGYQGAVGPLTFSASLEPRVLRVGEAARLMVRLAGSGNLQGLPAPDLALPAGLRTFPPHEAGADRANGNGTSLRSERIWTYVVIPDRPGSYRLAPPAVPYFDPSTAAFERAEIPPIDLEAWPPAPVSTASAAPGGPHPSRSARPDPTGVGKTSRSSGQPAVASVRSALGGSASLPWILAGSGLLALLSGFVWVKRSEAKLDDAAHHFEAELAHALAEDRPRRTAVLLESAWNHLLAARWELDTPILSFGWEDAAVQRGVAPVQATELGRIAEDLHFLRTAPQLSSAEALRDEIVERSRRLARELAQQTPAGARRDRVSGLPSALPSDLRRT